MEGMDRIWRYDLSTRVDFSARLVPLALSLSLSSPLTPVALRRITMHLGERYPPRKVTPQESP
jgi:hypothetical protein